MLASYADTTGRAVPAKLTKSRSKAVVKPILKKMGTQSAKSSLDLDRTWEEQIHYSGHGWGSKLGSRNAGAGSNTKGNAGVGWGDGETEGSVYGRLDIDSLTGAVDIRSHPSLSHARSTSGTSHASITTSGSGPGAYRTGSFVHPFQQTPRTSLSYANSLASVDQQTSRDYSPTTITEDEDLEPGSSPGAAHGQHHRAGNYLSSSLGSTNTCSVNLTSSHSGNCAPAPRRPSLANNRTSSLSDVNSHQPLRLLASNRSTSASGGSRLAHVASVSDLNLVTEPGESSSLSKSPAAPHSNNTAVALASPPPAPPSASVLASPTSPASSTMSPFRTSLEGFRLRSRSEVDPAYHQERIRQERQKWEDRERLKDMKRAKEEMKRRERADAKEAQRYEREQARIYKEAVALAKMDPEGLVSRTSTSHAGAAALARISTDIDPQVEVEAEAKARPVNAGSARFAAKYMENSYVSPPQSKKARAAQRKQKKLQARVQHISRSTIDPATAEKLAFVSHEHQDAAGQEPRPDDQDAQDVAFNAHRRPSAKRRTQGAWTSFMLWFRTRILRLQTKLDI
ncbi:hypothetical protein ACRALDRAFT_1062689 [Sodiomyces alcalophilus JCM 7366]|uniref:uncharacterized protein n=1 Tax=Sodiomyces alcalophilus JCM 7366 TaxID=591952 RepID=UPI0039B5A984